jgi:hypothetical protein
MIGFTPAIRFGVIRIEYAYITKIAKLATTFRYINESRHVNLARQDHQSANGQIVKPSESHRTLD